MKLREAIMFQDCFKLSLESQESYKLKIVGKSQQQTT